jgi:hypothetical protein
MVLLLYRQQQVLVHYMKSKPTVRDGSFHRMSCCCVAAESSLGRVRHEGIGSFNETRYEVRVSDSRI